MTPRQRTLSAFQHREPDRTPMFEKLIKSPVADELLGRPCAATNFHYRNERLAEGDWEGLEKQSARDLADLAQSLGFDVIRLYMNGLPPVPQDRPRRLDENTWQAGGTVSEMLPTGWVRSRPAEPQPPVSEEEQEAAWLRDLLAYDMEGQTGRLSSAAGSGLDDRHFLMIREARRLMAEEGLDLAIFSEVYATGVATLPPFVLRWFVTDPDLVHRYYARHHESALPRIRRLVAEGADIIALGGDLACDLGPMISPRHYREFIMPVMREQARLVRSLGAFSTNATDGDIWSILDDFLLGAEVDGYEEIDFAAGMDMARLKAQYGERCTFVGNIDIRHKLTSGTVAEVQQHTRECIEAGWGNGGHVLMSSNCIHEDCKTELFLAHLQAYRDYFGV